MLFDRIFAGIIGLVLLLGASILQAQQFPSMNDHQLVDTVDGSFSFLVGGHFYGSSKIKSGIPAATVLANVEMMNESEAHFLAHVGDLFSNIKKDIPGTQKAFIDRLNFPIFNAVGDHDLTSSSNIYQETFGKTYFSFFYQKNAFLFLDTDSEDSNIEGQQLELFKEAINTSVRKLANIFIFSHRPIWSEDHEQLNTVFVDNDRSTFGCNFQNELLPLLKTIPSTTKIYWFSGSMGAANLPYFYHAENEQLHFIQTAVKDKSNDGMLQISVDQGKVNITSLPLTVEPTKSIDSYNLDLWKSQAGKKEPFNFVLWLKNMVVHQYFWFGAGMVFLANIAWLILKRLLNRRQRT